MRKIDKRLADLKAAQESGCYTLCPRCGQDTMNPNLYHNALSRIADIMVCDTCGIDEAKLAWMNNPGTLYSWAALQPTKPPSDFKEKSGEEVWESIRKEQKSNLLGLYKRFLAGESPDEIRYCAFETCPGLTQMWTEPYQMNFEARDGTVAVQFKKTEDGWEMAADLIDRRVSR